MFVKVLARWKSDWNENKLIFWLEAIGTISSLTAAVLISFWPNIINLIWIFSFWLIGSISLAASSCMRQMAWPMILMITYTFLNIIGLYNLL
jgi:hypothetical protein